MVAKIGRERLAIAQQNPSLNMSHNGPRNNGGLIDGMGLDGITWEGQEWNGMRWHGKNVQLCIK